MDKHSFEARREKLRPLLQAQGIEALLVSLDANRYYLSGFELQDHQVDESAGCLVIRKNGRDLLCTDARYQTAAARLWAEEDIFIYGADPAAQIAALLKKEIPAGGLIGFEAKAMSVAFYKEFSRELALKPSDGLVEGLRIIKDEEEIKRLEKAALLNHNLMSWLPGELGVGKTERELAWNIERFFREGGASSLSFPSIVAVGPNAALPHAVPGNAAIREETCVLVDVGCRLDDYCSDQTRTFWVGAKPSPEFLRSMDAVRTAQEKAIACIRPGVPAKKIYETAWNHFDSLNLAAAFTHSLGHGVGLQTHEAPSLGPRSCAILESGMVVTVEPGLYFPEWGGIRWEYMVLVTEEGCRIL